MEPVTLPEEILYIICNELGSDRDFNTLYDCARSARSIAESALRTLYHHHQHCFAFNQTDDDFREREGNIRTVMKRQQQSFKKWLILWRSIIISSLEPCQTYKPYCRYLRILDFRNLSDMLEQPQFRTMKNIFYAPPLQVFDHPKQEGRLTLVDVVATINHIGDTVVPKASLLEEMSGYMRPGYFTRWAAQTPRLRRTVLWRGDALGNDAGSTIAKHCEHFNALSIHDWVDTNADEIFAKFLADLNQNTLEYLHIISYNEICRLSFEALGGHQSLKELRLNNLSREAMENLNGLKQCTNIEILSLEDTTGSVRLEEFNNDVFNEVIGWLSSCTKLRDVTIKKFLDGPAILAAVAIAPEVKWFKLTLEGYTVRNANAASFHTALAEQRHLESLVLRGNGDDAHPQDLDIMVSSICQLTNLKELKLKQVSDEFDMTHISNLALNLPCLEEFWTSGGEISSDILPVLGQLRSLRELNLFALTQFDYQSICDFIGGLDPKSQNGFQLSLMAVDQDFGLEQKEQDEISELIKNKLDGTFGMLKANSFRYMFSPDLHIWRDGNWKRVMMRTRLMRPRQNSSLNGTQNRRRTTLIEGNLRRLAL